MSLTARLTGAGWAFTDIPSQAGKRAVVTGGNSGIGFEVCRQLLSHGLSDLVIASRNEDLVDQAAEDLKEEFPDAHITASHLDLADFGSVRSFADELLASNKPIHLLINNGGRYIDSPFTVTEDGFEITMKVNYYGHVYLTQLLLPLMARNTGARIVLVSSAAEVAGKLDWSDLQGAHVGTSGFPAYARSKLFMLMYAQELQRRIGVAGMDIDVYATYPGVVTTSLLSVKVDFRYLLGIGSFLAGPIWGLTPVAGAMSTLYAATQPNLKGFSYIGASYLLNTFTTIVSSPWNSAARDPAARARLFDATLNIIQAATGRKVPKLTASANGHN